MAQTDDIFEARLNRINSGAKPQSASKGARDAKLDLTRVDLKEVKIKEPQEDQSLLLPVVAVAFLLIGSAAFAMMIFVPGVTPDLLLANEIQP